MNSPAEAACTLNVCLQPSTRRIRMNRSVNYVADSLIGLETVVVMFSSGKVSLPNAFSNSDRNALEVH